MKDFGEEFTVTKVKNGYIKVKGCDEVVNNILFDVVEKEIKEMTIAEISEALGYEVKIVKEEK